MRARDAWDTYYMSNYSFDYPLHYNQTTTSTIAGHILFKDYEHIHKLLPRESLYFYAINNGTVPQDLTISFSGAVRGVSGPSAALVLFFTTLTTISLVL